MRSEEVRALGDFAGGAAAGLAAQVREVHEGIAGRVFGTLGASAAPVRLIHDRVAEGAYTGAKLVTGAIVRRSARALSVTRPALDRRHPTGPAGRGRAQRDLGRHAPR
jgi:hypothetical protein